MTYLQIPVSMLKFEVFYFTAAWNDLSTGNKLVVSSTSKRSLILL